MPTRHEVLGLDKFLSRTGAAGTIAELVDDALESIAERYYGPGNFPPDKDPVGVRQDDIDYCIEIATYQHLELDLDPAVTAEYLEEGAAIAVNYFYGDYWKSNRDIALARKKSPKNKDLEWFDAYRSGLLLAFLSEDVEAEQKLVDYVEPWLPFDESKWLVSLQDNDYHKLLAQFIKHNEVTNMKLVSGIQSSRKQRPKMLLACLLALEVGDVDTFGKHLKKFLDYYIKCEFGEAGIGSYFSMEASILWYLAEWLEIKPKGFSDKQSALIMTRETLGLDA